MLQQQICHFLHSFTKLNTNDFINKNIKQFVITLIISVYLQEQLNTMTANSRLNHNNMLYSFKATTEKEPKRRCKQNSNNTQLE